MTQLRINLQLGTRRGRREKRSGRSVELRENLRSMPIDGQFDMWSQVWTKVATDGMAWHRRRRGNGGRGLVELPFRNSFRVSTSVLSAHSLRLISFIHSNGHKNDICIWFPTALSSSSLLSPPPAPTPPLVSIIFTSQVSSWATCVAYPGELNWTSQKWKRMWKEQHEQGDADEDVDVDDFHVEHALIS